MLKVKLGLTRRKKLPAFYILGKAYLPHKALKLLWTSRWLKVIEYNDEYTILEGEGNTLKLLNQYTSFLIGEWDVWKKYYIPHFPLHGKTVLDIGAGCGETAWFWFLHGASRVIAVEPNVKAVECLKENVERNSWNVQIIAEPFSLEHLKLNYDFMKMDGEGCEELLLSMLRIDKPCVVEVHNNKFLNEFERRGYRKIHSMSKNIHLVTNI